MSLSKTLKSTCFIAFATLLVTAPSLAQEPASEPSLILALKESGALVQHLGNFRDLQGWYITPKGDADGYTAYTTQKGQMVVGLHYDEFGERQSDRHILNMVAAPVGEPTMDIVASGIKNSTPIPVSPSDNSTSVPHSTEKFEPYAKALNNMDAGATVETISIDIVAATNNKHQASLNSFLEIQVMPMVLLLAQKGRYSKFLQIQLALIPGSM